MAAAMTNIVEDLEAQLTCVICHDIFREPRTLPCLHIVCSECIKNWNDTCQRERKPLKCPTCRAAVKVEDGDVSKLPSSFTYNWLLQLFQAMKVTSNVQQQLPECANCNKRGALTAFCPECDGLICGDCMNHHNIMRTLKRTHQPTLLSEFKRQNINSYINNRSLCKEKFHEEWRLEYYCKKCRKCVCQKCATTTHSSHDKVSIEEAAAHARMLIGREKQNLDELLVKHQRHLERCNEAFKNFRLDVITGKKSVRDHTRAMIKVLQDHENVAIAALDDKLEQRAREHKEEQREVKDNIHQIDELTIQCEKIANEQLEHYVLEGFENLQQVCKATVQDKSSVSSGPLKLNSIVYYRPNVEVIPLIKNLKLGEVMESVADPSQCYIESLSSVRCGFTNEFIFLTRNSIGNVCPTERDMIDVEIQDGDRENVKKELVETQPGTFLVKFKAEKFSPYKVGVIIGGKQIRNSPQNVETIDEEFKPVMLVDLKEMEDPVRLAVNDRGDIAVLNRIDSKDRRVFLFRSDGELLRHFGGKVTEDGKIYSNALLFIKDRIIISENPRGDYTILNEFGIDGTFKKQVCKLPQGVLVQAMCTTKNQSIACLCYKSFVKKSFITLLNEHNFGHQRDITLHVLNDDYWRPTFLACGSKIFVTFDTEDTIHVFNEKGICLHTFAENGKRDGQFNFLRGIALFGEEMLLACDSENHRVQVFNQDGQFIRRFGSRGSALGQMNGPFDVCVLPDGRVFVLEVDVRKKCHRVQIFKYMIKR